METSTSTVFFAETSPNHQEQIRNVVGSMGGKYVKSIGSAHIFLFMQPNDAIKTAWKVSRMENPPSFRIGIAQGSISVVREDVFGDAVNLAARLQGTAKPQEIYFSEEVFNEMDRAAYPSREVGIRQFKGIAKPIRVYALGPEASEKTKTELKKVDLKKPEELFDFSRAEAERRRAEFSSVVTSPTPLLHEDQKLELVEPRRAKPSITPLKASRTAGSFEQPRPSSIPGALQIIGKAFFVLGALSALIWWVRPHFQNRTNSEEVVKSQRPEVKPTEPILGSIKKPAPEYASLVIKTQPPGAQVFVNENMLPEMTPIEIQRVPVRRPIQIKVRKSGFQDVIQLLNLKPNEAKNLEIKLTKER